MSDTLDEVLEEHEDLFVVLTETVRSLRPDAFLRAPVAPPSSVEVSPASRSEIDHVAAILARLVGQAGLATVPVRLEDGRPEDDNRSAHQPPQVPFIGFDGEVAVFSLESLGASDQLAAALCHEVALCHCERRTRSHPYRSASTGVEPFDDEDVVRAAVRTVVLGWGAVTANGAHRFVQTGSIEGYTVRSAWSHLRVGAVSAGGLCFLLAVQAVVRDTDLRKASFAAELHDNQRRELEAWVSALRPHRLEICERLGVPTDPDPSTLDETTPDGTEPKVSIVRRTVYRVRRARTAEHAVTGGILGFGVFLLVMLLGADSDLVLAGLALPVGGFVAGAIVGARRVKRFCSSWSCGALLEEGATRCPGCGGEIEGEITVAELDELRARQVEDYGELAEAQFDEAFEVEGRGTGDEGRGAGA